MIKAVFFDLNGVLITSDFLSDRFEKKYGVPSTVFVSALKKVMAVVRRTNAPSVYSVFQPHFSEWKLDITESNFLDFWFSGESVDHKALEYVKELKQKGIDVFVVSNNFRERTGYYREHFAEIFENLTKAYFSWETGFVKPSEEALKFALDENNLDPHEVVYFDDSTKNIEIARNLGIDGQKWINLKIAKEYMSSRLILNP